MKKTFAALLVTFFLFPLLAVVPVCLAAPKSAEDQILPPSVVESAPGQKTLPTGDLKTSIIPRAINIFLGISALITLGVFIYAGVMLVIAQGNEQDVTNFKNVLIWSLVGLVFITTSYALVRGIMGISFD